jgi:peptidoglycan LD-endopeptidase CwlK
MLTNQKRNLDNIAKLADHTKDAALKWHDFLVKNDIDVLIYETIRTIDQQRANVKNGASQTMRSYHIVGQALDFAPVVNGKIVWDGYNHPDIKKALAEAKRLGFEWGGDWKSFIDQPHLQFKYKGYGTDTFGEWKPVAAVKYPLPSGIIREGDRGADEKQLQVALNAAGFSCGVADGIFGPKSKSALHNFQAKYKLVADGIYGPKTKAKLAEVLK